MPIRAAHTPFFTLAACCVTAAAAVAESGCLRQDNAPFALEPAARATPAPAGSRLPQVTPMGGGRLAMTWFESLPKGYRFQLAVRTNDVWSEARAIASGPDIAMFSADLPGVVAMPDGQLLAYWERFDRESADKYATVIQVARSSDEGRTWTAPMTPHVDGARGEHSFIAAFPEHDGVGLVWLDAQKQRYIPSQGSAGETWIGAMGLRYAAIDTQGVVRDDQFVDAITCDCCPNAATVTARGPVVAYRDRVAPEGVRPEEVDAATATVRDIYVKRLEQGRWSEAVRVHADNWVINACPDNGPALDADGDRLAIAWWTAADNAPRVQVAFSSDAGTTFTPPIRVDQGAGDGQVTIAMLPGGRRAVVGWQERGQTWARLVQDDGRASAAVALGPAPRRHRLPRWLASDKEVLAAWTTEERGQFAVRFTALVLPR